MAIVTKITEFSGIMSCYLEDRYYHFGVTYCLHLQDRTVRGAERNDECCREE
jgi:hypothetical protein